MIIIDQWNQTARLYETQVTVIYSRATVAVTSEYFVKRVICKTWTGTLTNASDPDRMPQNAASDQGLHYLIKIHEVKGKMKQSKSPFRTIFPACLHLEAIDPPVLSVLWLDFLPFFTKAITFRLLVCFPVHQIHSEKGSTLEQFFFKGRLFFFPELEENKCILKMCTFPLKTKISLKIVLNGQQSSCWKCADAQVIWTFAVRVGFKWWNSFND